ncbi:sulfite exporter TauE/SafE family protein [Nocardioides sp. B-3]|uniref:sulfite exporter TauE/SafE family protein n=1 Tax=Nocardioides sp. B-3 TaxID=2895565 RepID=UPI0021532946|nr:TSUP family transporter [Nocardioides sp. B-3]UUZ60384.1 TSUP family transporter [Nocardioides sp. B-3]
MDAVVGGGGLIQLPALLIGLPGASVVQIAATNKLASFCGTSISAATYFRRMRPDPRTFLPLMLAAFVGSFGGALVASLMPRSAFDPIIPVALVLVGSYVWFKPSVGSLTRLRFSGGQHVSAVLMTGIAVGFYDGAIGPGTGSFFVFAPVGLLGYDFLRASAKAKLANWATNLAALVVFIPQGAVIWHLALMMAAANIIGGYAGARVAMARGARFVRIFFPGRRHRAGDPARWRRARTLVTRLRGPAR